MKSILVSLLLLGVVGCGGKTHKVTRYTVEAYLPNPYGPATRLDWWGSCNRPELNKDGCYTFWSYYGSAQITLPKGATLTLSETIQEIED